MLQVKRLKMLDLSVFCSFFVCAILLTSPLQARESQRTFFKVSKLSCGYCINKINTKLKSFDGFRNMLANIEKGLVVVDHRPSLAADQISAAITSLGYPASVIPRPEYNPQELITPKTPGWRSPSDRFLYKIIRFFK